MCIVADSFPYTPYITGFGGIIVGAICSYFAGVRLSNRSFENSLRVMRAQEFNRASAIFKSCFYAEILLIEKSTLKTDFITMFNDAFNRHFNAVMQFMPYLSESEMLAIKEAWESHCYPEGIDNYERELKSARFIHYDHGQKYETVNKEMKVTEDHEISFEHAKKLATNNINALISFAKFK